MFTFEAHPTGMNTFCMAFIPGEAPLLATLGNDGARVWDLAARRPIRHLADTGGNPPSISCSPDGRLLVVGCGGSPTRILLWDWAANRVEYDLMGLEKVQCALLSPDACTLAMGGHHLTRSGWDFAVRRLRVGTWAPLRLLRGHENQTGYLAFSPDGTLLASGASDGIAILWGLKRREALLAVKHTGHVFSVAFSPDGRLLATASGNSVRLIDVARRKPIRGQLRGHRNGVRAVAFTPAGELASVSLDGTVRFWDARSRKPGRVFDWGIGPLRCLGFSPGGMLAAAASINGHVVVWDVDA
jgi:WD40 repeat protein